MSCSAYHRARWQFYAGANRVISTMLSDIGAFGNWILIDNGEVYFKCIGWLYLKTFLHIAYRIRENRRPESILYDDIWEVLGVRFRQYSHWWRHCLFSSAYRDFLCGRWGQAHADECFIAMPCAYLPLAFQRNVQRSVSANKYLLGDISGI